MASWLLTVLRSCLPETVREGLIGDLEELHAERVARTGRARAALWLTWQILTTGVRYAPGILARAVLERGGTMGNGWQTLRGSLRQMIRTPGHSAAMVTTMALGLGPAILGFTLVNGVILKPLPYPDPGRIVSVSEDNPDIRMSVGWSSLPNYRDWRDQARGFDAMAVFRGRSVSIGTASEPEYGYGAQVSSEFFKVFGVEPELGRGFTPAEATVDGAPVVVLSHDLWVSGYVGDPGILGRTVEIDGTPYSVVGVMPRGFAAPAEWAGPGVGMALWRPFPVDERDGRENRSYVVVGRLSAGVDLAAARTEIERVHAGLRSEYPEANEHWRSQVFPWAEVIVGPSLRTGLWVLMTTLVLVLAVAGANVVGLAANRILARSREIATRVALGASSGAVVAQVMSDIGVLVGMGGVLGGAGAWAALRGIQALDPGRIPRLAAVTVDGSVFFFGFALLAVVVLAVGLVASVIAFRAGPAARLRGGTRVGDRTGLRLRAALSSVQLATSFALLVGAGLMTRTFLNMNHAPLGFEPTDITAMTVALSWDRVGTAEERARFTGDVLDELRRLPGVASAGMINSLPLSGSRQVIRFEIDGVTEPDHEPALALRGSSPGYLETMGIPVISGRSFDDSDIAEPDVALVNETAARTHWPGRSPLGARVRPAGSTGWYTVVGVIGDVMQDGPGSAVLPEVHTPYPTEGLTSKSFVVRGALDEAALASRLREALRRVDPAQPVREIRPMTDWVALQLAPVRFESALLVGAGFLGAALAAIGLFAALATVVGERRRDIAVRVALGADRRGLVAMVARYAGSMLMPGLVGGFLLALGMGRLLRGFLYGVGPRDAMTLGGVALGLLIIGTVASLIPAARALAVEPAQVLREE